MINLTIMRVLYLLAFTCFFTISLSAQKNIAIKCGKLFDSRTGQTLINQVIMVKGNLVESIVAAGDYKQKTDTYY